MARVGLGALVSASAVCIWPVAYLYGTYDCYDPLQNAKEHFC